MIFIPPSDLIFLCYSHPEVGAGLQYATALGFLAIDVGQVLAFGFAASTPPSLAPVAQELEHLQDFGLDAVSYRLVFGAALSIVAASVVVFFVQEHVEVRAFVEPESRFPLLFLAMGGFLSTLAGPGFMPVLKVRLIFFEVQVTFFLKKLN